jgi:predicted nucleic acid-binding protein
MNTEIIVDTSVWIEFFRDADAPITLYLHTLLRSRRVIIVGMVLAEILQGVKDPGEANLVQENMEKLPYLEMTRELWQTAGGLSAALRRKGITIPLSDLTIAAVAISEDHEVFTLDPHFQKVPGLKLHLFTPGH